MTMSSEEIAAVETRKNAIFSKVGRNVVNLQRLETRFKVLQGSTITAPMKGAKEALEQKRASIARQTLGPITHGAINALFPEIPRQSEFENLVTEAWVTYSITLEGGEELATIMRVQLKKLVDDRNALIHHMFGGFDLRSAESCAAFEERLDEQFAHISEVFNWIEEIIAGIRELAEESKKKAHDTGT